MGQPTDGSDGTFCGQYTGRIGGESTAGPRAGASHISEGNAMGAAVDCTGRPGHSETWTVDLPPFCPTWLQRLGLYGRDEGGGSGTTCHPSRSIPHTSLFTPPSHNIPSPSTTTFVRPKRSPHRCPAGSVMTL